MKKLLLILFTVSAVLCPTLPALAGPTAVAPWPGKTNWIGQQATVYPAKLYASASYLLLFRQPGEDMPGVDQLALGRELVRQTFTINGLYRLTTAGEAKYYWKLAGPAGRVVWVKDRADGLLAALPFALGSEIAAENKAIGELNALVGATLWVNRNLFAPAELPAAVGHLAPVTVTGFKSAGPFSDTYVLTLRQEDGSPAVWTAATTGRRTAYGNVHFAALVAKNFFRQDPTTLFPHWAENLWPLIRAREIRTSWDREMVLMSWGDPDKSEKITKGPEKGLEEWRYGSYHLYFRDKLLAKIKIPDPAADKTAAGETKPSDKKKEPPMIEITSAAKKEGH
jgi:hypothetical protein